jgi:hypothetical protein
MKTPFIPFFKNYLKWNNILTTYACTMTCMVLLRSMFLVIQERSATYYLSIPIIFASGTITFFFIPTFVTTLAYLMKCWKERGYVKIKMWSQYRALIWTPQELRDQEDYFKYFPKEKEVIVASAVKAINGDVYAVLKPGRHHHCIALMYEKQASELHILGNTEDQGFMTNANRYIGRKEARALAVANGQALYIHHPELIWSENLWNTPADMRSSLYDDPLPEESI